MTVEGAETFLEGGSIADTRALERRDTAEVDVSFNTATFDNLECR